MPRAGSRSTCPRMPRRARMTAKKIVVMGLGRTGTTALFFTLKQAMAADTYCLFEPRSFVAPPGHTPHVLAKVLIGHNRDVDISGFQDFDKKLFLIRDPRDTLVSRVLYDSYNETTIVGFAVGPDVATVSAEFGRVVRTKKDGDRRNWLTPADVDFFRPWFTPYLAYDAYPDDWTLPAQPRIPPEHGSAYVLRLVKERRGVTPAS